MKTGFQLIKLAISMLIPLFSILSCPLQQSLHLSPMSHFILNLSFLCPWPWFSPCQPSPGLSTLSSSGYVHHDSSLGGHRLTKLSGLTLARSGNGKQTDFTQQIFRERGKMITWDCSFSPAATFQKMYDKFILFFFSNLIAVGCRTLEIKLGGWAVTECYNFISLPSLEN